MKADKQLKCKDCDWYGDCQYYENRRGTSQICKTFNNTWGFIAELEKIKAEFQNPKEISLDFFDGLDYAERVIDKRIAELKGETND